MLADRAHMIPDGAKPVAAHPVAVRQGSVDEPNSDAVPGIVDLVTIQRACAANIDALKAMDGVLGTVAGEALYRQLSRHLPKK